MSRDFSSSRVKTTRIIGSGANNGQRLIVHRSDDSTDSLGGISDGLQSRISALESNVFIYIDGIPNGKKNNTLNSITQFGGDVVVKGQLYADSVILSGYSLWETSDANDLQMTGFLEGNTGLFAIDLDVNTEGPTNIAAGTGFGMSFNDYTLTNNLDSNDLYYEFDNNGDIMPKA
tara:strand:- start:1229 stop:1753 length:525 start_codon:yes stop_codon:yes gene_type:complete